MQRYTIKHFNAQFPDDDACLEWLVENRWPEGITCPKCQQVTKHHKVTGRPVYACDTCGHHVSPMAGTIMEHSSTSMRLWFYAMYLMASTRCGIAAKQLERELGVTYKTAWRMFKQIRSMLAEDIPLEGSSVEIDATFVGGKAKNMRKAKRERLSGRGTVGKTAVLGMVERQGNVVTAIVGEESQNAVLPDVREKVLPSSLIYSDEHAAYNPLRSLGYQHRRVHHAAKVYAQGDAHTNTIEGFWSLVKREISGVNHAVSEKYLQSYLSEYSFRYNRRDQEQPMFEAFLGRVVKQDAQQPSRTVQILPWSKVATTPWTWPS